jgi:DNA (cytosine-5)-methyltransferase 1
MFPKRVLDLFCGAGGAAMGLHRAWPEAEIVGVDIKPQPRYPFTFVLGDAMTFSLEGFDFVWASPPCQHYCALKTMPNRREHPALIESVRDKLQKIPHTIENVFGAPLLNAIQLCGSNFNLRSNGFQLRRHRYFESNFSVSTFPKCVHQEKTLGVYGAKVRNIAQEKRHYAKDKVTRGTPVGVVLPQRWGFEAMGIDWMNIKELSEAIPPAYSQYIAEQYSKVTG